MSLDYESRLRVPLFGDPTKRLFTSSGLLLATGFVRVVIGGRGPYVEFNDSQVSLGGMTQVPIQHYYYDEWRTADSARLKLYHQKRTVDYADYLPGMWYATPFELFNDVGTVLIEPAARRKTEEPPPTLFD